MVDCFQEFRVRPWHPSDRKPIAELIASALDEFGFAWEPNGADRDVLNVEECYLNRGGEFWAVERDRSDGSPEVVGSGGYYPVDRGEGAVEIRKMYFAPTARGRGLGRFLLGQLELAIARRGFTHIWIETASAMAAARSLYESSGYQPACDIETQRCDLVYVKTIDRGHLQGVPIQPQLPV